MLTCGMLGGAGVKQIPLFCALDGTRNPTIGLPTKWHKARYLLSFMSFLEMEESTPITAAPSADALLGLRCSAWLTSLG
jgi:hypothetical protein